MREASALIEEVKSLPAYRIEIYQRLTRHFAVKARRLIHRRDNAERAGTRHRRDKWRMRQAMATIFNVCCVFTVILMVTETLVLYRNQLAFSASNARHLIVMAYGVSICICSA